jgi:hypothetical protein
MQFKKSPEQARDCSSPFVNSSQQDREEIFEFYDMNVFTYQKDILALKM